ncbi:MAG: hypothetical protein KDB04_00110 [Acidimicrobiales bacterium]|nr:hypothetical protein [Acidimicrobiales bacterium]HRW36344.1 hypothetical protein [Aquihabitans sp.]
MAAPPPAPRSGPGGVIPAEWPAQAADTIVDTIAKVRDKTTKPAIVAARAIVYGLIAAVGGLVALVLVLVVTTRMWDNWVPGNVWILYAVYFVLFSGVGLVLLRKANAPAPAADA